MSAPLVILALGSIFVGYLFRDAFIGLGTPFFTHPSGPYVPAADGLGSFGGHMAAADASIAAEFLPPSIALAPVAFSLLGAGIAAVAYGRYVTVSGSLPTGLVHSQVLQTLYVFLNNK